MSAEDVERLEAIVLALRRRGVDFLDQEVTARFEDDDSELLLPSDLDPRTPTSTPFPATIPSGCI